MRIVALLTLLAASTYLVGLGLVALVRPRQARAFLGKFAQTSTANALESVLRLATGLALLKLAPELPVTGLFVALGWILAGSALAMLALPRIHKRFADRAVPAVERLTWLVGGVALAGGIGLGVIVLPLF